MGRPLGSRNKRISTLIKVAKKYKISRPSMLQCLRYGKPYAKVIFRCGNKEEVVEFPLVKATKAPSKLQWFILGMLYTLLLLTLFLWYAGFI